MDQEVIFEFLQIGNYVKVTAFDVKSKVEISTITPSNISQDEQERAAINKLRYVMEKKNLL